jgi:hypothetical protein
VPEVLGVFGLDVGCSLEPFHGGGGVAASERQLAGEIPVGIDFGMSPECAGQKRLEREGRPRPLMD